MSFSISSAKLTGTPGDSGWAQVHDFKPADVQKHLTHGHLFAVVATTGKFLSDGGDVESVIAGRELITRLQEEYFGKTDISPYNALKNACEKVITEFKTTSKDVEIAACAVIGNVVYTSSGGGASVSILRGGMLANILESRSSSGKDVVSASGYPKESDILILATSSFLNTFPSGTIRAALVGGEPAEAVEKLAPTIHSGKEVGSLGAVFIKFKEDSKLSQVQEEPMGQKAITKNIFSMLLDSARKKVEGISKLPERKIFIKRPIDEVEVNRGRKLYISVGIILLILLLVSIGFGIRRNAEVDRKGKYQDRLISARHQLDEAVGLYQLDATRARELFDESQKVANELLGEGVSDPDLVSLSTDLASERGRILGEYDVVGQLFVDLSLVSEGFVGDKLFSSDDNFFVLNEGADRIIKVSFETKGSEVVAGPDKVSGAKEIASYADRIYAAKGDGVYEISDEGKRVIETDLNDNFFIYSYAGNIYILRKDLGAIERYTVGESGFSSGSNWLSSGVEPDFSNVVSWTIDGSIWTLDKFGEIDRYTLGNPQVSNTSAISPKLSNPKVIFTSESLGYIYILDPEASRVVVIDKDGNLKAQYKADLIKDARAFAVSEKQKEAIILVGDKLYSIELKHL